MGRIPELLGGGSEEESGLVKFKGKCRKSSPQPGVRGSSGEPGPFCWWCSLTGFCSSLPPICIFPALGSNPELKRTLPPE